jgi:hypothetical protein
MNRFFTCLSTQKCGNIGKEMFEELLKYNELSIGKILSKVVYTHDVLLLLVSPEDKWCPLNWQTINRRSTKIKKRE